MWRLLSLVSQQLIMNFQTRFKFTIEDESTLENKLQVSAPILRWSLIGVAAIIVFMALGAIVIFLSPMRSHLPGYLKESERTATQEQLMRLDSLQMILFNNERYLENLSQVLNPSLKTRDSIPSAPASSDSLFPLSAEESRFVSLIREREKYNVAVIAPLAAESMMFNPVNDECVITAATKRDNKAEIILPKGSSISAIADGRVISVSQSIREGGGSAVIIQHPKGFLSRYSRLGSVIVEAGDEVAGGQIIAIQNVGNARKEERIFVELWHNGSPLAPYDYIGDSPYHTYHAQDDKL